MSAAFSGQFPLLPQYPVSYTSLFSNQHAIDKALELIGLII